MSVPDNALHSCRDDGKAEQHLSNVTKQWDNSHHVLKWVHICLFRVKIPYITRSKRYFTFSAIPANYESPTSAVGVFSILKKSF